MSQLRFYTSEEIQYLLLPQDKKEILRAMKEFRYSNNTVLDILDKRRAEFETLTKDCTSDAEKQHKWFVENKLTLLGLDEDTEHQENFNPEKENWERGEEQSLMRNLI